MWFCVGLIALFLLIVLGIYFWLKKQNKTIYLSDPVTYDKATSVAVSGIGGFKMMSAAELQALSSMQAIENCGPTWLIVTDNPKYPHGIALAAVSSTGTCVNDGSVKGVGLYDPAEDIYKQAFPMYLSKV
jgi:hypothetical protein